MIMKKKRRKKKKMTGGCLRLTDGKGRITSKLIICYVLQHVSFRKRKREREKDRREKNGK